MLKDLFGNIYTKNENIKFKDIKTLKDAEKFDITFFDVSKTAFVSKRFISLPPEKGVTWVTQTCEAS